MAYTSLNELAAAIAPNVYASSTIGVKKSTVCTSAHSGVSLYTPASSAVSNPTRTLLFAQRGMRASTWSKTFGLSFDAQPAACELAVNLTAIMYQNTGLRRLHRLGIAPPPSCCHTFSAAASRSVACDRYSDNIRRPRSFSPLRSQ